MNTADVHMYKAVTRIAERAGITIDDNTPCGRFYIRRDVEKHPEYVKDNILYRCSDLMEVLAFIEGWTTGRDFLKMEKPQ